MFDRKGGTDRRTAREIPLGAGRNMFGLATFSKNAPRGTWHIERTSDVRKNSKPKLDRLFFCCTWRSSAHPLYSAQYLEFWLRSFPKRGKRWFERCLNRRIASSSFEIESCISDRPRASCYVSSLYIYMLLLAPHGRDESLGGWRVGSGSVGTRSFQLEDSGAGIDPVEYITVDVACLQL